MKEFNEILEVTVEKPHVFVLGAGASIASFPQGDKNKKPLPSMQNFISILGIADLVPLEFDVNIESMIIEINDNIRIWKEFNPMELSMEENLFNSSDANRNLAKLGFNKERIEIKNSLFDVLTPSELVRKRNKSDGY